MKKNKFVWIILIVLVNLLCIDYVFADATDESGNTLKQALGGCPSEDDGYYYRDTWFGGVRISIIDQNGITLSSIGRSFDFLTESFNTSLSSSSSSYKKLTTKDLPLFYNNATGGRSRQDVLENKQNSMNTSLTKVPSSGLKGSILKNLPTFKNLVEKYKVYLNESNTKNNTKYTACSYTGKGGDASNGFSNENSFMKCLTGDYSTNKKDVKEATAQMRAFLYAVVELSISNTTEKTKLKKSVDELFTRGCNNTSEVFVETADLALAGRPCSGSKSFLFGTAADLSKMVTAVSYNLAKGVSRGFYYKEALNTEANFKGWSVVKNIDNFTTKSSLGGKEGVGVRINWIKQDPSTCSPTCDSCEYKAGKIVCGGTTYSDKDKQLNSSDLKAATSVLSKYPNLTDTSWKTKYAAFMFKKANKKSGDTSKAGCCDEWGKYYSKTQTGDSYFDKTWKKAYEEMCEVSITCSACNYENGKVVCGNTKFGTGETDTKLGSKAISSVTSIINKNAEKLGSYKDNDDALIAIYTFAKAQNSAKKEKGCCDEIKWKNYYKDKKFNETWQKIYQTLCLEDTKSCDSCKYKNNKLVCTDDKGNTIKYSTSNDAGDISLPSGISDTTRRNAFQKQIEKFKDEGLETTALFAFSSNDDGGLDCCSFVDDVDRGFINSDGDWKNLKWQKAYNKMCPKTVCDCEIKNGNLVCGNKEYKDKNSIPSQNLNKINSLRNKDTKYIGFNYVQLYAYLPEEDGGLDCCDVLDSDALKSSSYDWNNAYNKLCKKVEETTCESVQGEPIVKDIHNCCTDGTTSRVEEYELKDIFCDDPTLGVKTYKPKENADLYYKENSITINNYCSLYCTERVLVELPTPISGVNGRYFQLTATKYGTRSPYIEGYRKCKNRIEFNEWQDDYEKNIEKQVESYNKYQENLAYYEMYDKANVNTLTPEGTIKIVCPTFVYQKTHKNCDKCKGKTGTDEEKCDKKYGKKRYVCDDCCSYVSENDADYKECKKEHPNDIKTFCDFKKQIDERTLKPPASCLYTVNEYTFNYFPNYLQAKVTKNNYDSLTIEYKETLKTKHEPVVYEKLEPTKECEDSLDELKKSLESIECEYRENEKGAMMFYPDVEPTILQDPPQGNYTPEEDVTNNKITYKSDAENYKGQLQDATSQGKSLEQQIDRCDNYFTKYDGYNYPEKHYKLEVNLDFYYSQAYIKTLGYKDSKVEILDTPIEFNKNGCSVDKPTTYPDTGLELIPDQYSTKYEKGIEKVTDFDSTKFYETKLHESQKDLTDSLHATYNADKKFTTDGKFHAECKWYEEPNTLYTLVPNGEASKTASVENFTIHNLQYKLTLSTLDGSYETHWKLSGLGSGGRFDNIFNNAGRSCANEDPRDAGMFTCKLHVEHEAVYTGGCYGSNGTKITVNSSDCVPFQEGYNLLNFKVVDPQNLFPTGTYAQEGKFAFNWTDTTEGQKAQTEIEDLGEKDQTYSPENLTYSFTLNSTDMQAIRSYNNSRINNGGYSDFTLKCNCNQNSCTKCLSPFLTNLAAGNVAHNGINNNVTGWSNSKKTIIDIRNKLSW